MSDVQSPATRDPAPGTSTPATARAHRLIKTQELWSRRDTAWARHELARRFLPLARRLAARYRNPHDTPEDLVQVASVGLLQAINRFDPERGTPFASFAVPTILGELKRYFRDTGWAVRVPRGTQELALRVEKTAREMTEHLGRSPQVDELADAMKLPVADILDALQAGNVHYASSLEAPLNTTDPEAATLLDVLGGEDDRYALIDTTIDLVAGVRGLPHLERTALDLRLRHDLRQREIADRMGCSQMQVSRLLARAAARLKAPPDGA